MEKIAVFGGGGTGCCIAADLTSRGFAVTLFEEKEYWDENIEGILKKGGIQIKTRQDTSFASAPSITDSVEEALRDAELVIVSLVAWRHDAVFEKMCPYLRDGMAVVLSAGNLGSIRLKRKLGPGRNVLVGEMQGNIFPCRMLGDGESVFAGVCHGKPVAAFPATDTEDLIRRFAQVYDFVPAKHVLETALNAPNVVVHLPGSVLSTAFIEKNPDFALYAEGLSEGVLRAQQAIQKERDRILDILGCKKTDHVAHMQKVLHYGEYPELDLFRSLKGPNSMQHRYIREDATNGLSVLIQLGERLGVPTPIAKAFVEVAGAVNGENYFRQGVVLEDFGIIAQTADEIENYLMSGL